MATASVKIGHLRLGAPAALLPELASFYGDLVGSGPAAPAGGVTVRVGETILELREAAGSPFYHVAFLVPGDRFDAALAWVREHVELLPDTETGEPVFDFTNWDAKAVYFHDPAGNIVELIAHRGVGEAGAPVRSRLPSCSGSPRSGSSATLHPSPPRWSTSSGWRSGTAPSRARGGSPSSAPRRER